jgi:hypothetical protein
MAVGFLLLPCLALPLIVAIVFGVMWWRGERREGREPHCGRCNYNLTGAVDKRCPECGALFIEAGVKLGRPAGRGVPRRSLIVAVALLGVLLAGGLASTLMYRTASIQAARARQAAAVAQQQAQIARQTVAAAAVAATRPATTRRATTQPTTAR